MKKAPYCLALLTLALALAASTAEAAKFYKWTDADGVTHYSADPPAEGAGKASEIRVKSRPAADTPAAATPAAGGDAPGTATAGQGKADAGKDKKKDEAPKATGKEPAQYAEKCKQLRQDLQTIQDHERIKTRDANGEVKVLSDDEKNARLDATQREIKAYCE